MKKVFVNGCFDPLHQGHIFLLKFAKSLGHHLTVAVNSDESLAKLKGSGRPRVSLDERMTALRELRCVDEVIPYSELTACNVMRQIRPDIVVKGSEYSWIQRSKPQHYANCMLN